jgi:hypothetical protein
MAANVTWKTRDMGVAEEAWTSATQHEAEAISLALSNKDNPHSILVDFSSSSKYRGLHPL